MKAYPVTVLCQVMRVSRSGFYQYVKRVNQGPDSNPAETSLAARISAIFKEHRSKYGARRIMTQLLKELLRDKFENSKPDSAIPSTRPNSHHLPK